MGLDQRGNFETEKIDENSWEAMGWLSEKLIGMFGHWEWKELCFLGLRG